MVICHLHTERLLAVAFYDVRTHLVYTNCVLFKDWMKDTAVKGFTLKVFLYKMLKVVHFNVRNLRGPCLLAFRGINKVIPLSLSETRSHSPAEVHRMKGYEELRNETAHTRTHTRTGRSLGVCGNVFNLFVFKWFLMKTKRSDSPFGFTASLSKLVSGHEARESISHLEIRRSALDEISY